MNPCSHLVNGPCGCAEAEAVAARASDSMGAERAASESSHQQMLAGVRGTVARSTSEPEEMRVALDNEQNARSGWQGPYGFIEYPGRERAGVPYQEWLETVEHLHRQEAKVRPMYGYALAGAHAPSPSTYAPEGAHRIFTRVEVLTVLKTLATQEYSPDPDAIFARIITAFERME